MFRAFGHPFAMCCDNLGAVGSSFKMVQFEPTTPSCHNTSQPGRQTRATCITLRHVKRCVKMLRVFVRGFIDCFWMYLVFSLSDSY